MAGTHPRFEIPTDPHGRKRYESAMKHVEAAKKAGKSSEEIHAVFKRVMAFDPMNIDAIPKDEAHAGYRSAMFHMKAALANGKSSAEAHALARKIRNGEAAGKHCSGKK